MAILHNFDMPFKIASSRVHKRWKIVLGHEIYYTTLFSNPVVNIAGMQGFGIGIVVVADIQVHEFCPKAYA